MKSVKPTANKKTGICVGRAICSTCVRRNRRNFSSCFKRDKIPAAIIIGDSECRHYKRDPEVVIEK